MVEGSILRKEDVKPAGKKVEVGTARRGRDRKLHLHPKQAGVPMRRETAPQAPAGACRPSATLPAGGLTVSPLYDSVVSFYFQVKKKKKNNYLVLSATHFSQRFSRALEVCKQSLWLPWVSFKVLGASVSCWCKVEWKASSQPSCLCL